MTLFCFFLPFSLFSRRTISIRFVSRGNDISSRFTVASVRVPSSKMVAVRQINSRVIVLFVEMTGDEYRNRNKSRFFLPSCSIGSMETAHILQMPFRSWLFSKRCLCGYEIQTKRFINVAESSLLLIVPESLSHKRDCPCSNGVSAVRSP